MVKEEHCIPLPPYRVMVHFLAPSPNSLCGSKRACPLCGYLLWHNLASLIFSTLPNLAEVRGPWIFRAPDKIHLVLKLVKGKAAFWVWTGKQNYLCIITLQFWSHFLSFLWFLLQQRDTLMEFSVSLFILSP